MYLYFDISYLSFLSTVPYLTTYGMVWEYDKRKEDSSTGTVPVPAVVEDIASFSGGGLCYAPGSVRH